MKRNLILSVLFAWSFAAMAATTTFTGNVKATTSFQGPSGSAAAATYRHSSNAGTGLYFPSSATVGLATNGTQLNSWNASGLDTLASPTAKFRLMEALGDSSGFEMWRASGLGILNNAGAFAMSLRTNGTEGIGISSGGLVTIGASGGSQTHAVNGAITVNTAGSYLLGTQTTPLLVKSIAGNSNGLRLYANTGTDVAYVMNGYNTSLILGANSIESLSLSSAGLATIGAASGTQSHAVNGTLDILTGAAGGGTVGAIRLSDISTNATEKQALISMRAKLNAEENISLLYGSNFGADTNALYIGGGASTYNALTNIYFHTAATSTTLSGTQRGSIDQNGLWTIGTASGTQTHIVNGQSLRLNLATAGSSAILQARHSDNTSGNSHAQLYLETGGGSGGDPKTSYFVTGGQDWSTGIDNSASDAFVVSNSGNLGTQNAMSCSTGASPVCTFPGQLVGKGTATNDSPSAGYIGEVIECNLALGSATNLTDDDYTNICTLSLTAGDWLVSGVVELLPNGAGTPGDCYGVVLNASGGNQTGAVAGKDTIQDDCSGLSGSKVKSITVKPYRFSTAGSASVYVKARFNSTTGTTQAYGSGMAQRIR